MTPAEEIAALKGEVARLREALETAMSCFRSRTSIHPESACAEMIRAALARAEGDV